MLNEQKGCEPLVARIRERIENSPGRWLPFREYMRLCLYDEQYGYYMAAAAKIGKEGDFYTSSSIGSLMGEMLALSILGWHRDRERESGSGLPLVLAEWGGGSGRMARQALDRLRAEDEAVYARTTLHMIETSPWHRELQRIELAEHEAAVRYMTPGECEAAPSGWSGAFLWSNELLDAFPQSRLRMAHGQWQELGVGWDSAAESFVEEVRPCTEPALLDYAGRLAQAGIGIADGQTIDICPEAADWLEATANRLGRGRIVTIDYGGSAAELFAPERAGGTLMCYYKHMAHDDPYRLCGLQDITAQVDFSALLAAGSRAGWTQAEFMTQRDFLVRAGIMNELRDHSQADPFHPAVKRNRAIRQLLLGDRMAELFKVLILSR